MRRPAVTPVLAAPRKHPGRSARRRDPMNMPAAMVPSHPVSRVIVAVAALGASACAERTESAWLELPDGAPAGVVLPAARYDAETPDGRNVSAVAEACRAAGTGWACRFQVAPWADTHDLWLTAGDKGCDADGWAAGFWNAGGDLLDAPCPWPAQFWNTSAIDGAAGSSALALADADLLEPASAIGLEWDTGGPVAEATIVFEEPQSGIRFGGRVAGGVLVAPEPCPAVTGTSCRLPRGPAFDARVYLGPDMPPQLFSSLLLGTWPIRVTCVDGDSDTHCRGGGDDCDDQDPGVYPGAIEVPYDGVDNDCDGSEMTDADEDGFDAVQVPGGTDCDDQDPGVYPGAIEVSYDGVDDDCDGSDMTDADEDGFDATLVAGGDDCDDADPAVNPGAPESCNGIDDDCDGDADEGLESHYYQDADGDGFGADDEGVCGAETGFAPARGDCDDADPAVHPGADDEPGDGKDSDCGGDDGPQPHAGLSARSFPTLQEAILAAAGGDTVWVGPGAYLEADVTLAGRTITLASTHGPEATVIDAQRRGRVLFVGSGEGPGTTISGFTLTGGLADQGGGLYAEQTSPLLDNLIMTGNEATLRGGGFSFTMGAPRIERTRVESNTAPGGSGGGGFVAQNTDVSLADVRFRGNEAGTGGGLHVDGGHVAAERVQFLENTADTGGAVQVAYGAFESSQADVSRNTARLGGGFYLDHATVVLWNVALVSNSSTQGGAMYMTRSAPEVQNGWFEDNTAEQGGGVWMWKSGPVFTSVVFTGNRAAAEGGALYSDGCFAGLVHCVLVFNTATTGGGLYSIDTGVETWSPFAVNSVVAFNDGMNLFDDPEQPDHPTVVYSDIYNGDQENHNLEPFDTTVLDTDPQFLLLEPGGGPTDLHLATDSPLVDAGEPTVFDADGSPADIGCYGWEAGATWDRDGDGWFDYFWPGSHDEPPEGIDPEEWDPDDLDPNVPGDD